MDTFHIINKIKLTAIFCSLFLMAKAQTSEIDSLENLLQTHIEEDTARVNLLNEIAYKLEATDIDKFLQYAAQVAELSDKLSYKKGTANHLNLMGLHYETQSNYSKAIEYYQKSMLLFEEMGDEKRVSNCLHDIGFNYFRKGSYLKALEYMQSALQLREKIGYQWGIARSWDEIGLIYWRQGDYPRALEFYHKALRLREEIGDKSGISDCFNNIGLIYKNQDDYLEALEYFQKALLLREELGNKRYISVTLNNIGDVYQEQGNYPKALEYYKKALLFRQEVSYNWGIASTLNSIGNIYLEQENYPKALEQYQNALTIALDIGAKGLISRTNYRLAGAYLETGMSQKAKYHAQKGYDIAKEIGNLSHIKNASAILAKVYNETGEYQQAYTYHVIFKQTSDSLLNESNTKRITRLQAEYEFQQEKDAINLAQEKERVNYQIKLAENRQDLQIVILGLIISLVLGAILLRFYKSKQKANNVLSLMNATVLEQKEELIQQAHELKATNNRLVELDGFKSAMTGMIVHDLKNPLNSIIGLTEGNYTPKLQRKLNQTGRSMLNMVTNILEVQKLEEAITELKLEDCNLLQLCNIALNEVSLLVEEKNLQLHLNIDEHIWVEVDKDLIVRILVNLLTNAIKYTPLNGEIRMFHNEITCSNANELSEITVYVADSGIGIAEEKQASIFKKFVQIESKSAGRAKSTGLGLNFCKMAVELHEQHIGVNSKEGKGATFWFTLKFSYVENITQELITKALDPSLKTKELQKIELDEEDQKFLMQFYPKLRELEVYEVSQVREVLHEISPQNSQGIKNWCVALETTIYSSNEDKYDELLKLIEVSV